MFRIDPHTLYSREDLERELDGLMDVETFLQRINPRKRYKAAWWGQDMIDALNGPFLEEWKARISSRLSARKGSPILHGGRGTAPGLEPIAMSEEHERCP